MGRETVRRPPLRLAFLEQRALVEFVSFLIGVSYGGMLAREVARLAQPLGRWREFRRPFGARRWYPTPASWTPPEQRRRRRPQIA